MIWKNQNKEDTYERTNKQIADGKKHHDTADNGGVLLPLGAGQNHDGTVRGDIHHHHRFLLRHAKGERIKCAKCVDKDDLIGYNRYVDSYKISAK